MKSSFFGDCPIAIMSVINLLLCTSILLSSDIACVGLTQTDGFDYNFGPANAGIIRDNTGSTFTDESEGNVAISVEGVANAGMIDFFDQGINGQNYNIDNSANNNFATSVYNSANSGSDVTIVNDVGFGVIDEQSTSTNNTAVVSGNKAKNTGQTIASSGTRTQLNNFKFLSDLDQYNTAANNNATNRNKKNRGDANSGVYTQIEYFEAFDVTFDNNATNNQATTMNGFANSGVFVDIGESYFTETNIISSASDNVATTSKGDANAGVINNIDNVNRQFINGAYIGANANNNVATANDDGESTAGFSLDIGTVDNVDLSIQSTSSNNSATTSGKNSNAFDAVSGNKINIDNVNGNGRPLDINLVAESNTAENDKKGTNNNNAISGNQVTVGNVQNSIFTVTGDASNNSAITRNGDAVSGNKVTFDNTYNTDITVDLTAEDNTAISTKKGDAVAGNEVTVANGQGTTDVDITVQAFNNTASANKGDAIAGNKIKVENVDDLQINGPITSLAADNTATSVKGDAIIGTTIEIEP